MRDDRTERWAAEQGLPVYCPRCRRERTGGGRSCSECGEGLLVRGYCSVCESRWSLRVGEACPKHDIVLISEEPQSLVPDFEESAGRWVLVESYSNSMAAEAARLRLEAEGIPARLEGQRMAETYSLQLATGGVRLVVPSNLEQDARVLLNQVWADEPTEEDDLGEVYESVPDSEVVQQDRAIAGVALWGSIFLVVVLIVLYSLSGPI